MIHRALAIRFFEASYIIRWNDLFRPFEMTELDKHAHKMVIAYCLGKYEEDSGKIVNWHDIIKGCIFELLRRVVLSDIKSPVYRRIKDEHKEEFKQLNEWVWQELKPDLIGVEKIENDLLAYIKNEDNCFDELTKSILMAAHLYSSYWEFNMIKHANRYSSTIAKIDNEMQKDLEGFMDMSGMRKIVTGQEISNFIDLCGQLRFQVRWGNTPRIPKTSVLGHMLLVACFTYLFSVEIGACDKRIYNDFFGGLFHDLPEATTRDIISPVKHAFDAMPQVIKDIEKELVQKEIYPLINQNWIDEFKYFTTDEFKSRVLINNRIMTVTSDEISDKYNNDIYHPIDGELIDVADKFSAFLEAYITDEIGIKTRHTMGGLDIPGLFKGRTISGLSIPELFAGFK